MGTLVVYWGNMGTTWLYRVYARPFGRTDKPAAKTGIWGLGLGRLGLRVWDFWGLGFRALGQFQQKGTGKEQGS